MSVPRGERRRSDLLVLLVLLTACADAAPQAPDPERASPAAITQALQTSAASEQAFADFERWLEERGAGASRGPARSATAPGEQLALRRKAALKGLAQVDPEAALARALPAEVVTTLPAEVLRHIEQPLDARGDFLVLARVPDKVQDASAHALSHFIVVDGVTHPARVYGRRLQMASKYDVPLHGFVLDGLAVLSALPARVVARVGDAVLANVGGQVQTLASVRVLDDFVNRQVQVEAAPGPRSTREARAESSWTRGPKRLLYMRVDFSDLPGEPVSVDKARAGLDDTSAFFLENSSGATWLDDAVITPVLRLPQTAAFYGSDDALAHTLLEDARAVALEAGYDTSEYDFDMLAFQNLGYPWGGQAYVGAKGAWIQFEFDLRITGHELGHNYGVWHANYWSSSDFTPFGAGESWEYGNPFDLMGGGYLAAHHFDVPHKLDLGWLTGAEVPAVTGSGTYRVFAHDLPGARGVRGLQLPRDQGRSLFLEYRARSDEEPQLHDGLMAVWSDRFWNALIDSTPSDQTPHDAVLALGRTLHDPMLDTYITPLAKVTVAGQPAIDVMVQRGPFPGNRAPTVASQASHHVIEPGRAVTFRAIAHDEDGDVLSYHWDFGDGQAGATGQAVSRVFPESGFFIARLEVSDMKGGRASSNIPIRVGDVSYRSMISGVVMDGSRPLEGVPVRHEYDAAWTDSAGRYYLVVWSGTYRVSPHSAAHTFTPSERVVDALDGQEVSGIDFRSGPAGLRIDTGSGAPYVDASGARWQADLGFADGLTVDRGAVAIDQTSDDGLYQTERYSVSSYSLPIANGSYAVKLHFAETYEGITGPGQRVFRAGVEDLELGAIDVFARTGGRNRALVVQTHVRVEDGVLDVRFTAITQNTMINAIEVTPIADPAPILIESGGNAPYRDVQGRLWESDRGFADGITVDRGDVPIEGSEDDRLFQTERYAVSSYRLAVPNGRYQVTLHFAETYEGITGPGQRVFHATLNDGTAYGIDPFAWGGGLRRPSSAVWVTEVRDGTLHITFTPVVQNTLVNAIEIVPMY